MSHWSTALSPNELMEPSYTAPNHSVGMTKALFTDLGWLLAPTGSVLDDFNGDGRTDILWRNASGELAVWLMNANGTSVLATGVPGGAGLDWTVVGVGDFNGDGRSDILWRQPSSGTLAVWLINTNGTSALATGVPGGASADWTVMGVGDFNGDGRADILWRHTSGTLAVWLMNANGTSVLATGVPGGAGLDWTVVGIGDFNGDGRADILWRQPSSGTLAIWLMNTNGTSVLATGVPGGASTAWSVVGVADFNGDGRADILWRQASSGTLAVWLVDVNGMSVMGTGVPGGAPSAWAVVGVGDFNGDNRADVLWRHTSGTLAVWLMNVDGTSVLGTGVPGGASTDWAVQ